MIPRERQDRRRPLPAAWELGPAWPWPPCWVVALVLVVADVATRPLRARGREHRRVLYPLPGVVAVVGAWKLVERRRAAGRPVS